MPTTTLYSCVSGDKNSKLNTCARKVLNLRKRLVACAFQSNEQELQLLDLLFTKHPKSGDCWLHRWRRASRSCGASTSAIIRRWLVKRLLQSQGAFSPTRTLVCAYAAGAHALRCRDCARICRLFACGRNLSALLLRMVASTQRVQPRLIHMHDQELSPLVA